MLTLVKIHKQHPLKAGNYILHGRPSFIISASKSLKISTTSPVGREPKSIKFARAVVIDVASNCESIGLLCRAHSRKISTNNLNGRSRLASAKLALDKSRRCWRARRAGNVFRANVYPLQKALVSGQFKVLNGADR